MEPGQGMRTTPLHELVCRTGGLVPEGGIATVMLKNLCRALLVTTVILAAAGSRSATGQEANDDDGWSGGLSGDWALNRALSDDPSDQLQNIRGAARPPGRTPSETGRRPQGGSPLDVIRRAVEGFGIDQTDSTVTIAYPDRDLVLSTDGRKQKIPVEGDRELEYRAWREGASLFLERKLDGGVILTEQYSVHAGTGRLHVLTRLEGDRLPRTISFMRVYDPAEAETEG